MLSLSQILKKKALEYNVLICQLFIDLKAEYNSIKKLNLWLTAPEGATPVK